MYPEITDEESCRRFLKLVMMNGRLGTSYKRLGLCFLKNDKGFKKDILAAVVAYKGKQTIIVNEPFFLQCDQDEKMTIILHELGHIGSGHIVRGKTSKKTIQQQEFEADELAFTLAVVLGLDSVKRRLFNKNHNILLNDKVDGSTTVLQASAALFIESLNEFYERNNREFVVTETDKELAAYLRDIFIAKTEARKERIEKRTNKSNELELQ